MLRDATEILAVARAKESLGPVSVVSSTWNSGVWSSMVIQCRYTKNGTLPLKHHGSHVFLAQEHCLLLAQMEAQIQQLGLARTGRSRTVNHAWESIQRHGGFSRPEGFAG